MVNAVSTIQAEDAPVSKITQSNRWSVLELANGDFVRGSLVGIENGTVTWQADSFARALTFPQENIDGIYFPRKAEQPKPVGTFSVELFNRDTFFGELLSIDETNVTLQSPRFGRLHIARQYVHQIVGNDESLTLRAPRTLSEWQTSDASHWRQSQSGVTSTQPNAWLFADVGLPNQVEVALELSWSETPSFSFGIGVGQNKASLPGNSFTVETWDSQIVAQRNTADTADVASLQSVTPTGQIQLLLFLDQKLGTMLVFGADGTQLANLTELGHAEIRSGIKLLVRSGNVTIKNLAIRTWSGRTPTSTQQSANSVVTQNGSFDGKKLTLQDGQLTVTDADDQLHTVPLKSVHRIDLSASASDSDSNLRVMYEDGSRVTARLISSTGTEITTKHAAISEEVRLPVVDVRSISLSLSDDATQPDRSKRKQLTTVNRVSDDSREGILEMLDTRLHGSLVEGETEPNESCLVWKPVAASDAVPLRAETFGRIDYRDVTAGVGEEGAPEPEAIGGRRLGEGIAGMLFNAFRPGLRRPQARPNVASRGTVQGIYLRTGDTIPCEVVAIGPDGVHIETPSTDTTLVPSDKIKAVQLASQVNLPVLDKTKRQRVLTLPRMQRNSPPLHLLFSADGDVLRGTIVAMDETHVEFEVRLETYRIPRERISSVVWLHQDEVSAADGSKPAASSEEPDANSNASDLASGDESAEPENSKRLIEVQVVSNDGSRFSLFANSFSGQTLHGDGEVLTNLHANVNDIDQLFLGGFIRRAARSLPYHRWVLIPATDPKFVNASAGDSTGGQTAGTESPLVGQVAPELRLPMLEGDENFDVSLHRGHCVVLDFWATWCGPCMQLMPKVDEIVKEFEPQGVQLFAVNLSEQPDLIRATLERRGLNATVVLDRDGVAAARYEATAIPQTVVIGPDGKVAFVFVGATREFATQFRAALASLTAAK